MVLGLPLPSPLSVASLLVNEGIFVGSSGDPDPELIDKLRQRFDAATSALAECDRQHRLAGGRKPSLLAYRVLCVDEDTAPWSDCDLGNLRVALNALVRVFRVKG